MQSPYVVGRWVRGDEHYDRHSLIEYLLTAHDTALWVVGTRRMGKTSLLRQLELVTDRPDSIHIPLFWDLQGGLTPADLTRELRIALEDAAERFHRAGVEPDVTPDDDAVTIVRRLARGLMKQERHLLLLMDEAETLMQVARTDPFWLARLRLALQEGNVRTIIASTRALTGLMQQSAEWVTSPFLFGFHMVILWPLHREGAEELVHQVQAGGTVRVDPSLLEEILCCTNHHPYLIQYLCEQLYQVDADGQGYLRPLQDEDLAVNQLLASYFELDYQRLTPLEQRLLLHVLAQGETSTVALTAAVATEDAPRVASLLESLRELGMLRRTEGGWAVGSEFLARWLRQYAGEYLRQLDAPSPAPMRGEEPPIEAVARQLGIAAERIRNLAPAQIGSEAEFFFAVRGFFYEVRHLVEQDEGYRLLVTQNAAGETVLRSEEEIQLQLKLWLRPFCERYNVDINRETMTGRGLLDFKFSIGHDFRCLVEVKLYSSAKLVEGVEIQLPIYLQSDRCRYGLYVPFFLDTTDYGRQVRELQARAAARARSHGFVIDVVDICAWRPRSASKADVVEDAERYQAPALPAAQAEQTGKPGRRKTRPPANS
jgi:hypothetical protein